MKKPLIYLAYEKGETGNQQLGAYSLYDSYKLALDQNLSFVNEVFNFTSIASTLSSLWSAHLANLPQLTETQVYHLSPFFFVNHILKNVSSAVSQNSPRRSRRALDDVIYDTTDPVIQNFLENVIFIHKSLPYLDFLKMFNVSETTASTMSIFELMNQTHGLSTGQFAHLYNLTSAEISALSKVTLLDLSSRGIELSRLYVASMLSLLSKQAGELFLNLLNIKMNSFLFRFASEILWSDIHREILNLCFCLILYVFR